MIRRIAQLAGLGLAALLLAGCNGQQCQAAGQLQQLERAAAIARVPAPAPQPQPRPAPAPQQRQQPAPRGPSVQQRQAPQPQRRQQPGQQQAPAPIIVHQDSGPSPWLWWWMLSQQDNNQQQCSKDGD